MHIYQKLTRTLLVTAFTAVSFAAATAQDFPSRPIRLVVPYAAGGGNDLMARTIGEGMSKVLKQPVIIETRPGAGGALGITSVIKSEPDGYTIVMGGIGSTVLRAAIEGDKMPFDSQKDLAPIVLLAKASPVLVVQRSLNVASLKELVALAKSKPMAFGSAGTGSAMHLVGELFKQTAQLDLVHVPYAGQGPAMNDLLAGSINFVFTDVPLAIPYTNSDRVRIIAIAGKERAEQLPDVPTAAEAGFPELVMENWYALYAPKNTPASAVKTLKDAAVEAINLPDVRKVIEKSTALIPLGGDGDALRAQMNADTEKWMPVAAKAQGDR